MRNFCLPAFVAASLILVAPAIAQVATPPDRRPPPSDVEPFQPLVDPRELPQKRGDPSAPGEKSADAPQDKAPLASTPEEREKLLTQFYAELKTAPDDQKAHPIVEAIERLWVFSESDTIAVLMERSMRAVADKNPDLALRLLDTVVELAPDYAEGWNRRAYVLYTKSDYQRALGDLRRVLALEPNHFKALDGLGQILREIGEKKAALQAYRELERIHPNWSNIKSTVEEMTRDVEGQGI